MIVDGDQIALKKERELFDKVKKLDKQLSLGIVVFKGDPAGEKYSELKKRVGKRVGIRVRVCLMDFKDKEGIEKKVRELNDDRAVTGLMIQYPGKAWAEKQGMAREKFLDWWQRLVDLIDKRKDVDGLRQDSEFELGVVKAVMEILLLFAHGRERIVVVGNRGLVGKGVIKELKKQRFEVRGLGRDDDLVKEGNKADILISVTGKPNLITADMVKEGAMVIDVGWPRGDVEFETVKKKAAVITPVPGGVGPVSVVSLLENLVKAGYTSG